MVRGIVAGVMVFAALAVMGWTVVGPGVPWGLEYFTGDTCRCRLQWEVFGGERHSGEMIFDTRDALLVAFKELMTALSAADAAPSQVTLGGLDAPMQETLAVWLAIAQGSGLLLLAGSIFWWHQLGAHVRLACTVYCDTVSNELHELGIKRLMGASRWALAGSTARLVVWPAVGWLIAISGAGGLASYLRLHR